MKLLLLVCLVFGAPAFSAEPRETSEVKFKPGTFTEAKAAEPQDRAEGSKAAAKAAAAGALMGKVQCMVMMDKARKAEDSGDSALMMVMANQQCQQANEMEKSAKENEKGRKAVSAADIPTQAKFEAGKAEIEAGSVDEVRIAFDEAAPSRGAANPGDLTSAPAVTPETNKPTSVAGNETETQNAKSAQAANPVSGLNPIEKGALGFDESGKPTDGVLTGGLGLGGLPSSGSTLSKNDLTGAPTSTGEAVAKTFAAQSAAAPSPEGGEGAAGSDAPAPSGDPTLDELMAQLMGGPQENEMEFAGLGEAIETGGSAPEDRANIFEYASLRYLKLQNENKRLGPEAKKAAPPRAISSVGL